jgi:N-acetylneuraminic acid mutarotase
LEELESRLSPATFTVNAQLQVSRLDNLPDAPVGGHAVVFFESAVTNYQVLLENLSIGTDAVILGKDGDGLKEMATFLADRHDLTSIGVVAHGAPGMVALGTLILNADSLTRYRQQLAALGSSLAPGGELDLWSCDVAVGDVGEDLVRDLAAGTGAAVAAGRHGIGAMALGGDWQLDFLKGGATGKVPFSTSALANFHELLGTWSAAASMLEGRTAATATLLANGKVLVTGGLDTTTSAHLASAELYDPSTNTWTPAASMATARQLHMAILLNNGKVLVMGGANNGGLSSAELYDSVNNTWSSAGSMAFPRWDNTQHWATLLTNGKVLVVGDTGHIQDAANVELYDPASNSWSPAAPMPGARWYHTTTLLSNGDVLVSGGRDSSGPLFSAVLYNPSSDTWSTVASPPTPREEATATLLGNGDVLVAAGYHNGAALSSCDLYDPQSNTWNVAGSMATARSSHNALLLDNGTVLVAGGWGDGSVRLSSAELYDPATNIWSSAGDMATARDGATMTSLGNGKVLIAGGGIPGNIAVSSCELYVYDPGPSVDVTGFPLSTTVSTAGSFTVTAKNGDGTINTSYTATIHFTSTDPHAILPGDYTFTAADHGVHTFSATFKTGGTQSLRAADTAAFYIAGFEAVNVLDPAVANPSRSTLTVAAATIFSDGSTTVTLTARNDVGDPVTTGGLPFVFSATGGGFLSSASFSNLTDRHNGTYTATFTGSTAFGPATYTISATLNGQPVAAPLPTITVIPAVPATQLAITNLSATSVAAGGAVTFTVAAEDSAGITIPNYAGTVQLTSTDSHATAGGNALPITYTFVPSDNGAHTFTVALTTVSSQTITATD